MKLNLFPPAVLHETTRMKEWQQARQFWFVVQHRPDTSEMTMKHELIHVWQFWIVGCLFAIPLAIFTWPFWFVGYFMHNVLMGVSKLYRKHMEAMAFAASVHHGATLEGAAQVLTEYYKLGITEFEASKLIKKYHKILYK